MNMSKRKYTNEIDVLESWFSHETTVTAKELVTVHGISDRQVREIVNYLRCNGVCVCSSNKGYWLARNEIEIITTINSLKSRVNHIQMAIAGLESVMGE